MVTLFGGSKNRATVPGLHLNPGRGCFSIRMVAGPWVLLESHIVRLFRLPICQLIYLFGPGRMRWYPAQEDTGVAAVAATLSNQAAAELEDMKRGLVRVGLKGQMGVSQNGLGP